MGAVLGKTTYIQLVFMGILELIMFTVNKYVGEHILMVSLRFRPPGDALSSVFAVTRGSTP